MNVMARQRGSDQFEAKEGRLFVINPTDRLTWYEELPMRSEVKLNKYLISCLYLVYDCHIDAVY